MYSYDRWHNTKYELPRMQLIPYYRYESMPVLICLGTQMVTARLVQDEEKDNPPCWELVGRDVYNHKLADASHWQDLPRQPAKNRACGNPDCRVSTGIWEVHTDDGTAENPYALTFGSGELSAHGTWSKPCHSCARDAEERDAVPPNSYWPRKRESACTDA